MKNKNIGYLMKEGVRGIFLHGFMTFAAICVTVACLIIVGSFSLIMQNLDHMVLELEQAMLAAQAPRARIILSQAGELLDFGEYRRRTEESHG